MIFKRDSSQPLRQRVQIAAKKQAMLANEMWSFPAVRALRHVTVRVWRTSVTPTVRIKYWPKIMQLWWNLFEKILKSAETYLMFALGFDVFFPFDWVIASIHNDISPYVCFYISI